MLMHSPIAPDTSRSLEAEAEAKTVTAEAVLHSAEAPGAWSHSGRGWLRAEADGAMAMCFSPDPQGRRARGSADDPDYATYGHCTARLDAGGRSLEAYNRLLVEIEPRCPGMRVVNVNLSFSNAHGAEGTGFNTPPGGHLIHLTNNAVNRCYLEIADYRRDAVDGIALGVSLNGRDLTTADTAVMRIVRVAAQAVPNPEKVSGWQPADGHIIYSMSGYAADGAKTAVVAEGAARSKFSIISEGDGSVALSGRIRRDKTTTGTFGVIDFSELRTPGRYRIEAAGMRTEAFDVAAGARLWEPACAKVLNFIFCQRCGYPVEGVHGLCHTDLMAEHAGVRRIYAGGWHDAGDLSQQTLQTADVAYALLELYDRLKTSNPLLATRLREEALWGIEFMLRNRFGDGYHASSVGLLIWQDGAHGTHDDIGTVRVQNVAFDNYLYAAYEAYAARVLADTDAAMADYLGRVAREDYGFACARFAADGFGGWINPYEHTYNTGESQHMATASWAASLLYELTGEESYATDAADYGRYVLQCRQCEPVGREGVCGFFYRTPEKRSVVHYIHQSREQVFMQALTALCRTQPQHAECGEWRRAIADYGGYLKWLMAYTAPYGMLPAGIYRDTEADDTEAFFAVHLFPPSDARERFSRQAAGGERVAPGYFVKRFPVWFNIFNGNLAVHTSMGKAAAICAGFLDDAKLRDIAREQLYWTVGKNPFAQSLIYGEGHRYPDLNNFSSGRTTGAMPVGIRSLADTDEPYWPQVNAACYKEVWVTSAGKWLSLVAETI